MPSFYYECKFKKKGFSIIAGVDEVGRGPLAGPVLACALVLNAFSFKEKVDDSKKLSHLQRERAYGEIVRNSVFGIGTVGEEEIDELNIRRAALRAMEMAIVNLINRLSQKVNPVRELCFLTNCADDSLKPLSASSGDSHRSKSVTFSNGVKKEISRSTCVPEGTCAPSSICFLIDGNIKPEVDYYCETIIGGDAKSLSIACASIVAKVTRDKIMCDYHRLYPEYGFVRHKGYGTAEHLKAISRFGQSPIHRRSFRVNSNCRSRSK